MADLEGKTALVTGGSSGVGLATARLLVDRGARVMVTGRNAAALDEAATRLGPLAVGVVSDSASLTDIEALAARVRAEFDQLDLLFANAGVTRIVPFADTTEDDFDAVFGLNAKGTYFTVQKMTPLLRNGGAVVLTTSVADVKGLPRNSAYAASKAAQRSMARSFARELQPQGIRVNALSPGPIDTGVLERARTAEDAAAARARLINTNPMQRFGTPDEVARAVLFLAFEATYTTGAEFTVDGGASQL